MKGKLGSTAFAIAIACLLVGIAGCKEPNRGTFTAAACAVNTRDDVPTTAAVAIYFDKNGAILGTKAEDMAVTQNNKMCGISEAPPGPGNCPSGTCAISIPSLGRTYCKPLPC